MDQQSGVGKAALSTSAAVEFDSYFDRFLSTATRVETLPAYAVGGAEAKRITAFRKHRARPLRNVLTDPWLARIARTSLDQGKQWTRVRIVDDPLTDYQRYQMASYRESQAVGEWVYIVRRADVDYTGPDFWLFDDAIEYEGSRLHLPMVAQVALIMEYDERGRWLGFQPFDASVQLNDAINQLSHYAVPLNLFLAQQARRDA